MVIKSFPPVDMAGPDGLLALGGDLEVASLLTAYRNGIFPWPSQGYPLLWFAPPHRAILRFEKLKVPKRLERELKKKHFTFAIDRNFSTVIKACAEGLTRNSRGTWILPEMIEAYLKLHQAGYAHSFECYQDEDQLVGGLYGVGIGKMFAGESMFFWESGASKAALLFACETLKKRGGQWMDVQTPSPLLTQLGAEEIPRQEFMELLQQAIHAPPLFPRSSSDPS